MHNLLRWSPYLLMSVFFAAFFGRMIYRYRQRRHKRQWYHASGAQRPDAGGDDMTGLYATRSGFASGDAHPAHAHAAHFAGGAGGTFDGGGASGDWSSAADAGGGDSGGGDGGGGD